MFGMVLDSAGLFFKGKLFKNYKSVFLRYLIALILGVVALVLASQNLPIWISAIIGGGIAGFILPMLYKNLKYA